MQTSVSAMKVSRVIRKRSNKHKATTGPTPSWQISVASKNARCLDGSKRRKMDGRAILEKSRSCVDTRVLFSADASVVV